MTPSIDKLISEIEDWKPIRGYFKRYYVSSFGRVITKIHTGRYGTTKRKPRIKSLRTSADGYLRVTLCKRGGGRSFAVSRLVLQAFIGSPPTGFHAAHMNGNKNRLCNLRWVSAKENESHKQIHGTRLYGEKHHQSKIKEKNIKEIFDLYVSGMSASKIAKVFGVDETAIYLVLNKKTWKGSSSGFKKTKIKRTRWWYVSREALAERK